MKILIVEDDELVAQFLRETLEEDRSECVLTGTAEEGLAQAGRGGFDAIVLDLNLPGMTGFEFVQELRDGGDETPVLMLTARSAEGDVIRGLDVGADDYLTKPCKPRELLARLRAVTRRRAPAAAAVLRFDDLEVDRLEDVVRRGDRVVHLTPVEYKLLIALLLQDGQTAASGLLQEHVWGSEEPASSSLLSVHITHLRAKLNAAGEPDLIRTVRGVGYRIGHD